MIFCFLDFLQPGNGIIKETWYKAENQGLDAYIGVEAYPTCPDVIENLDDFNDAPKYEDSNLKYIMVRYKGYFIPPETGSYRYETMLTKADVTRKGEQ